MMLIFGLSTLHQCVGRSEHQSCVLIASPKTETGIERMTIMTQTNDGFELSERDLEMRGPGDFSVSNKVVYLTSWLPMKLKTIACQKLPDEASG